MTYPPDHNQQIYACLQAWRQFLEPLTAMAAMAAGMAYPAGPWTGPPTYPMPGAPSLPPYPPTYPVPPQAPAAPAVQPPAQMPADYAQQLFGYLQGWRQQLEQMTGAPPTPPSSYGNDGGSPGRRPLPPDAPDVGRTSPPADGSLYPKQGTTAPVEPPKYAMAPANPGGSLMPGEQLQRDSLRQAAVVARGPQIGMAPVAELGRVRQRDVTGPRVTSAPVGRTVAANPAIQTAPRSNYAALTNRALGNVESG
ncbi:hypothetical protein [Mycobacterium sp. DL99]|uniref:hypothetical protein n=1 Tax=Mycobacterium sp. DL99 TaxID=2528957 RepID=UPI0025705AD6|nr:hypothetical protein [Mycobacterium sp. DL99]